MRWLFNKWRYWDSFGAMYANLSLLIAVVYYEIDVITATNNPLEYSEDINSGRSAMDSIKFKQSFVYPFRMSILITSVLAMLCFFRREGLRRSWMKSFLPSINEN